MQFFSVWRFQGGINERRFTGWDSGAVYEKINMSYEARIYHGSSSDGTQPEGKRNFIFWI